MEAGRHTCMGSMLYDTVCLKSGCCPTAAVAGPKGITAAAAVLGEANGRLKAPCCAWKTGCCCLIMRKRPAARDVKTCCCCAEGGTSVGASPEAAQP